MLAGDSADAMLEALRPRNRPRTRQRLLVASVSESGSSHGSAPLASWPSVSRITGVIYLTAIRTASYAQSKQSAGVDAAIIGIGDSPCRPYIDCSRSACSGLVGIPVDG